MEKSKFIKLEIVQIENEAHWDFCNHFVFGSAKVSSYSNYFGTHTFYLGLPWWLRW